MATHYGVYGGGAVEPGTWTTNVILRLLSIVTYKSHNMPTLVEIID